MLAFNHLGRWECPETGGWPGSPVYRPLHSGPRTRDSASYAFGGKSCSSGTPSYCIFVEIRAWHIHTLLWFFRSLTFMSVGLAWSCWLRSWKTRVPKFRVSFWSARWVSPSSPPTVKFASINTFDSGPQAFTIRPDKNAEDISCYLAWLTRTTTILLRSLI